MSKIILNANNSFVTFYNLVNDQGADYFITDTECGIQKDFCYPIYDEKDLLFQTNIASTEVLTSSNIVVYKVVNGTGVQVNDVVLQVNQVGLFGGSTPIYNIYFSFFNSTLTQALDDGDCFQISVVVGTIEAQLLYMVSNQCFKKVNDKCLTSKLRYTNTDNAFGFYYDLGSGQPNSIRLPIYFKEPIVSSDKNVYVKSDGSRKLLSARLSKQFKGYIDAVGEDVHQKLVVALNHDDVRFVPEDFPNINGFKCTFEDEYNNEFPSIMQNVNVWPADFTIFETPFNNFNSNCG
jgi:hypothetical protein